MDKQTTLFEKQRLRRNNGRYCTEEQYRIDRIEEENKRLRIERDKYFRMAMVLSRENERLERKIIVLKSKMGGII